MSNMKNAGFASIMETANSRAIEIFSEQDWKKIQKICQRAGNTWDDAPPDIKEFIDVVTEGKVLQDYYAQANLPRL